MTNQKTILLTALIEQLKNDVAPEMKIDDYFEIFSNEQILKEYDLSYEEIMRGTIGNGGDGGIDGLFLFANEILIDVNEDLPKIRGTLKIDLFIIQSKNTSGFSEDVLDKFISSANDIFSLENEIESLKTVYNSEFLLHIDKFRELYMKNITKQPQLNINYLFSAKGVEVHSNVTRKVAKLKETILNYFDSANFKFDFITAEKLLELARTRKKETFTLKISESPIGTDDGGYICLVRLDEYFKLITDDDQQIQKYMFDANVRDYQGSVVVNKSIANSLLNEKDYEFWWLNNGITILTDNASVASKILTITSPQIVNGCQTSFEIYSYFKNHSVSEDGRNITIRVIKTNDDNIRARIIQSTNSQTAIPPAVLSATDPLHRNIEEYLKHHNLYYDRRKNFWKKEELGTPFSFAVLSTLLCFLQIFPFILFCLDSSTIYLSYPSTIFRSYRAGGAGRINWSDFFFDGVGQFYCPLTALHSSLPLLFSRSRLLLALRFAPAIQTLPHDSALLSR